MLQRILVWVWVEWTPQSDVTPLAGLVLSWNGPGFGLRAPVITSLSLSQQSECLSCPHLSLGRMVCISLHCIYLTIWPYLHRLTAPVPGPLVSLHRGPEATFKSFPPSSPDWPPDSIQFSHHLFLAFVEVPVRYCSDVTAAGWPFGRSISGLHSATVLLAFAIKALFHVNIEIRSQLHTRYKLQCLVSIIYQCEHQQVWSSATGRHFTLSSSE